MIRVRVLVAAAALLTTSLGPRAASANPADAFGLGARIPAMGGAGVATTDDTNAGYYNPAALGRFHHIRFDLAYQYAQPRLDLNHRDVGVDPSRGTAAGLAVPGRLGPVQLALGATFFLPDRAYVRTRALRGGQPRFQLYDNRPQRFLWSFNLGVSLFDGRVAVGGGLTYMSATKGTINLRGRVGFPDANDSDLVQGLDMDVETKPYPEAGVLIQATDWLAFGFSYRGQFQLNLDQVVDIRGSVGSAGEDPVVEDGFFTVSSFAKDHFQPAQLTAGLSAKLPRRVTLAFDLGYYRWSAFENPATIIDIDLDVGEFNDQINITEAPAYPAPDFDDIVVPRLGVEWRAIDQRDLDLDVRGGYSFEPSPAPEQTGENNFVDNDKHTLSVGAGATFDHVTELLPLPFSLDAYVAWTILPERTHEKINPADPVGDYVSGGSVLQLGIGSRWRF